MSDIAIRVENLSKRYRIGQREPYKALRDVIVNAAATPFRRLKQDSASKARNSNPEYIWALKDVSFEIKQGEVVGIIGRNGAGKTTLLKILSRITTPTEGFAEIHGRIASLLEVGTGFHPELTGRENVYLSGAILGMRKHEIDEKFDEIVKFAEVEKFIDTPLKHYSSGMQVRLAFAVAAHLEPEILLVDEVLAVGDAAFQKKCLGKMGEVAMGGRTVLFVSHNMSSIQRLCNRALLLVNGQLTLDGITQDVIEAYLSSKPEMAPEYGSIDILPRYSGLGDLIRFSKCLVIDSKGRENKRLLFGESFVIYLEAIAKLDLKDLSIVIGFDSILETRVVTVASEDSNNLFSASPSKPLCVYAQFDNLKLTPGTYWLTIGIRSGSVGLDHLPYIFKLEVLETADKDYCPYSGTWGFIHTTAQWNNKNQPRRS